MALYYSGRPGLIAVVVDWNNLSRWADLWASSHKLRHKLFIEHRGWEAPKSCEGMELDEYDDPDSKYIIVTDRNDKALAMARVRPTTVGYMIKDIFPEHYPQGDLPCSMDVWEATRFAAAGSESDVPKAIARRATKLLIETMREYAAKSHISRYIAIMPLAAYRIIRGLGGPINEIGEIVEIDGKRYRVAEMPIDNVAFDERLASGKKSNQIDSTPASLLHTGTRIK